MRHRYYPCKHCGKTLSHHRTYEYYCVGTNQPYDVNLCAGCHDYPVSAASEVCQACQDKSRLSAHAEIENPKNPYEAHNRFVKAVKFEQVLSAWGITSDQVGSISEDRWREIAEAIGVKTPSDQTIAVILQLLIDREKVPTCHKS